MRSILLRRALSATLLGGIATSSLLALTPGIAGADLPAGTKAVAAAGSDTTENVMAEYLSDKTTSNDGTTTYTVKTYNIPAFPAAAGYQVENDGSCNVVTGNEANFPGGTVTWHKAGDGAVLAPSGSGAGRTRLSLERTNARSCVDIGRSSSKGSEAGFQYYGFALDAVAWSTSSLKAPLYLTRAQVKDIYLCNVTSWAQVGGLDGPIQRYLPQSGSGTRNVFESEWLDSPASYPTSANGGTTPDAGQPYACPAVKVTDKNGAPMEENQGNTIADADIDKAILPYSAGVWAFQKNNSVNPSLDKRNNVRVGAMQTVTGSVKANALRWNTDGVYELDYVNGANPSGVISDQNTTLVNGSFSKVNGFSGVRFLFNVVDSSNALSYGPAVGLVGFDNIGSPTFKSPLCNNQARTTILAYGFAPLTTSGGGASNLAASTCRKF